MPSDPIQFIERYGSKGKFADLMKTDDEIAEFKTDFSAAEERLLAHYAATKQEMSVHEMIYGSFANPQTNTVPANARDKKTFGPDTIREMMKMVENVPPPISNVSVADHHYDMLAHTARPEPGVVFGGIPVRKSDLFPYEIGCSTCDGTGEGVDSTYCQKCHGAGAIRVEGMMQQGRQTILLTSPLPKKFAPSFPTGLVPPPSLCRGLA